MMSLFHHKQKLQSCPSKVGSYSLEAGSAKSRTSSLEQTDHLAKNACDCCVGSAKSHTSSLEQTDHLAKNACDCCVVSAKSLTSSLEQAEHLTKNVCDCCVGSAKSHTSSLEQPSRSCLWGHLVKEHSRRSFDAWLRMFGCFGLFLLLFMGWMPQDAWGRCRYKKRRIKWHTVQPGESCWSIAIKLFGDGRKYRVIHKYNDLGKLPHILKPGLKLCFPASTKDPDARILWKRRNAEAKPPRASDWRRAYNKMALWSLYNVRTRRKSMAKLGFLDKSNLLLRELSRIIIYGSSAQRIRRRTFSQRTIEVKEGVVRGGLASLDEPGAGTKRKAKKKRKPMVIKTPAGRVELNSSSAQIEYRRGKKTSVVSVYQGMVNVKARGKVVRVPEDFGTYVKKGKPPAKPRPLPKAPGWLNRKFSGIGMVIPGRQTTSYTVHWTRVRRGFTYRLEWSRWSGFQELVGSVAWSSNPHRKRKKDERVVCHQTKTQCTISRLRPGQTYFVRVSARDDMGMEGRFSKRFQINVVQLQMKAPRAVVGNIQQFAGWLSLMPPRPQAMPKPPSLTKFMTKLQRLRAKRRYQGQREAVQLYNKAVQNLEIAVGKNTKKFRAFQHGVQLLGPKKEVLRLRIKGQPSIESVVHVHVLKVLGALSTPSAPILWRKTPQTLKLRLFDENKNPVYLPRVSIRAYPGGPLSFRSRCDDKKGSDSRGCFRVTLPKYKKYPGPKVWVVASWPGGELARVAVAVKTPKIQGKLTVPKSLQLTEKKQISLSIVEDNKPPTQQLEGLTIRAYPGGSLHVKAVGQGRYVATLPVFKTVPGKKVWVVANWAGGELDRREIVFKLPDHRFLWPEMPASFEWSLSGPGLPSRAAKPVSMVGLSSFIQQTPPANDGSTDIALRLALRGQLAFWKQRASVDVDLPWLQTGLLKDAVNQNRLGDFRLGAKIVAFEHEKFLLSPSLRLRFPTGGLPRAQRDMGLEPGVLVAWKPVPNLHLSSNQILVIATDFGPNTALYYSSSYAVAWRLWKFLSVGIEFDMGIGLLEPNQTNVAVAMGLGGSIRFHLDRFRVGIVGGGALNDAGRRLFGGFTLGLTLDIGFQ